MKDRQLQSSISAHIDALLWSECDENSEPFDKNYSARDIDADTIAGLCADCAAFLARCEAEGLADFDALILRRPDDDADVSAGHDFLLTRNGHGAGFWDGDWKEGEALTAIADSFPGIALYVGDDGKVYGGEQ